LRARWDADVIAEQPNWLSVMIGINDVWRTYDRGGDGAVAIGEYEATYRELLQEAVAKTGAKLILADPYMIEPDTSVPMRAQMDTYGAVVARLAEEFGAIHIATQQAYDVALQTTTASDWAPDQIHPGTPGHAVIAIEYLRAIGFEL
jgi:lysophospholipase L1-like esterase